MSRATCRIYALDAIPAETEPIAWSVYEGTSDCQPRNLSASSEQAWEDNRKVDGWADYCADEGIPVVIHSCYGDGREWRGRACLVHMMLLEGDGCYGSGLDEAWAKAKNDPACVSDRGACWWRHRDEFAKRYVVVNAELARLRLE